MPHAISKSNIVDISFGVQRTALANAAYVRTYVRTTFSDKGMIETHKRVNLNILIPEVHSYSLNVPLYATPRITGVPTAPLRRRHDIYNVLRKLHLLAG
jgi:hypothetical protein